MGTLTSKTSDTISGYEQKEIYARVYENTMGYIGIEIESDHDATVEVAFDEHRYREWSEFVAEVNEQSNFTFNGTENAVRVHTHDNEINLSGVDGNDYKFYVWFDKTEFLNMINGFSA